MGKDFFVKQQLVRYEELKEEVRESIFTSIKQEGDPKDPELFSEIISAGSELVTLMSLYREQLSEQQELPMSIYNEEIQNFNVLLDFIKESFEEFIEKNN